MSPKPIVVVGSINMDLVVTADRIPQAGETLPGASFATYPGGKGANQAVAVGRLGHPVSLVGRVGQDSFGQQLRASLEEAGVDTSAVRSVAGSSGVATIVVSSAGQNSIVVVPGANAALLPEHLEDSIDRIASAAIVLAQLETPLQTVSALAEICRSHNVPLVLDPAPARELPPALLAAVAWLTPNESEAGFYLGAPGLADNPSPQQTVRHLLCLGPRGVILKRGEHGFHLATAAGQDASHPAFAATAVDTTAAGDAFNGAFAVALAEGMEPFAAARFAAAAASISVSRRGAQPSMATRAEVEAVLAASVEPATSRSDES